MLNKEFMYRHTLTDDNVRVEDIPKEYFTSWYHEHLYEYRHLRNNDTYWEKPRYCFTCEESTLKHNKKLLKERDKWIYETHGIIRKQSAHPDIMTYHGWRDSGTGELENIYAEDKRNFGMTRWGEINESPHDKYHYRELNEMFCREKNYNEYDFSYCKNECKREMIWRTEQCLCDQCFKFVFTLSFPTKKSLKRFKYPDGIKNKLIKPDDSLWDKFN